MKWLYISVDEDSLDDVHYLSQSVDNAIKRIWQSNVFGGMVRGPGEDDRTWVGCWLMDWEPWRL